MENIMTATTAPAFTAAPRFGTSGYQSTARSAAASSCVRATGASWAARGRHAGIALRAAMLTAVPAAAVTVMTDALKGAFPGPDAWSPPTT